MKDSIWNSYKVLLGEEVIDQLFQIAGLLKGAKILHVSSTREGGGVAEILHKMTPLMKEVGLNVSWEVIEGNNDFFQCTKTFHNLLQGNDNCSLTDKMISNYVETNKKNAEKLAPFLQDADFVMIHDPQPLSLIDQFPNRKGKWIWRCHVDTSSAHKMIWEYLRTFIDKFDASVFSLDIFSLALPHPMYIIPPSIDPFTEKNIDLEKKEVASVLKQFGIDSNRPIILQVSRFDTFKDPIGVIKAYKIAKQNHKQIQLILAGGGAIDDPEGGAVLNEIVSVAEKDPDIHVINLPSDAHRIINAFQRGSDIVLQKSIKEGFGLTVSEALWKMKPVIGGNTGGIRIQVINNYTGFLVNTPEGAANRIDYLLQNKEKGKSFGIAGHQLVKENFLITRHLRDYLNMMATLVYAKNNRLNLAK